MNSPLLLGHRGARSNRAFPENTLASFDQALADGCGGFEFDVRLTADGQAVICHDPHFKGIEIARATAAELPAIPILDEVLARYHHRVFLDIELKVHGLEKIVSTLLKKYGSRGGFVVSSFLPEVLRAVCAEDRGIPLGLICETQKELSFWNLLPIEYVIPHSGLLDVTLARRLAAVGEKIIVWTVNSPEDMRRFRDMGIAGIISDDTDLLCRTLKA
jgi:glycerophosphoryl diester phosphodiesterase